MNGGGGLWRAGGRCEGRKRVEMGWAIRGKMMEEQGGGIIIQVKLPFYPRLCNLALGRKKTINACFLYYEGLV